MKKILPVFFIIVVIFNFAGCSNIKENKGQSSSETATVSKIESTDENNKNKSTNGRNNNKADNAREVTSVKKINITVGNTTFKANLEDNETAKVFLKQLPLIVDMSELNGNEKYSDLSSNLRADTASNPGKIKEGDLMLYGNKTLVLFYKGFNTSYSYVKLGHIDNAMDLDKALGSGSAKVTFSIIE
jgi:Uncharacterized conserved protein